MKFLLENPIYLTLILLFVLMMLVDKINTMYLVSPKLFLLKRWIRCSFFSLAIATMLSAILPQHHFAILLLCATLIYGLAETGIYWILISLSSHSPYAGMPKFELADNAWRPEKNLILMKTKILEMGFKQSAAMISKAEESPTALLTYFDSADSLIRLNVSFISHAGTWMTAYSAHSIASNGGIVYTEALPLPFGLYYPERFEIERFPLLQNPFTLLKIHEARMKSLGYDFVPINIKPLQEYKNLQLEIESLNRNIGLINEDVEEDGYFSSEGKYCIWKEMILINYFPFLIS